MAEQELERMVITATPLGGDGPGCIGSVGGYIMGMSCFDMIGGEAGDPVLVIDAATAATILGQKTWQVKLNADGSIEVSQPNGYTIVYPTTMNSPYLTALRFMTNGMAPGTFGTIASKIGVVGIRG